MSYPRIVLAATKSGSGKTTVTCGILSALKKENMQVCSFKCGPDYIDPMFHRNVLGVPSGNLDTYFTDHSTTRGIFVKEYIGELAIIEGVMGLYDGAQGLNQLGSTYDLAIALKAPIVLVIDGKGAGYSILAEIRGFLDYDSENLIVGVILNRTSAAFGAKIGNLIEEELHISYLGNVTDCQELHLSGRHLGLVLPNEIDDIRAKLEKQTEIIEAGVDLGSFINLAVEYSEPFEEIDFPIERQTEKVKIGIAFDDAFCFYYRENLDLLEAFGAQLTFFSPIKDSKLPDGIQGLILGGGYPENYLKQLSSNKTMLEDIKNRINKGLPTLAECGGFMYLMDRIVDRDNNSFPMVGLIPGEAMWQGKLSRFGYARFENDRFSIKGHEFHYFDTDNNGDDFTAIKPSGQTFKCIHKIGSVIAGFPHLYYPSAPDFARRFIEEAANYEV